MDQETRTDTEQRLEQISKLLEEVVDDNTAVVASMNQLAQSQQAMAADLSREVAALRGEVAGGLAYRTLKDLVIELTSPLAAMEAMIAAADFTDPDAVATHVRSLTATLRAVLGRMGATPIVVDVGAEVFDPVWHRCVGVLDPDESPFPGAAPRTVVRVVEEGYVLDGRLLTPATVEIQASRPGAAAPAADPAAPDGSVKPAGPTGPAAPDGAVKPAGPTGPAAPDGSVKPAGPTGPAAPDGSVKPAGPTGPAAPDGSVKPAGPTGPAAPDGSVKPAGPTGPAAPDGSVKPAGPTGPAAPDGSAKPAGPAESAEPAKPADPAKSAAPAGPAGPAKSAEPAEPADSAEPAKPDDPAVPAVDDPVSE